MTQVNRRQWLRAAGLTGAASLMGGMKVWANPESLKNPVVHAPSIDLPARLSANENPYGPSEKVRKAMIEGFDMACRYPFMVEGGIIKLIAEKEGVDPDCIVLTSGSGEGLHAAGLCYGLHGGEIVAADPTFQSLLTYAEKVGGYVHRVPLREDLQHDLEAMDMHTTQQVRLVFVCNPNNPTGSLLPAQQLRDFVGSVGKRTTVFVDEAYFDYIAEPGYPSMLELVKKGYNVIVSRTFSKVYGLAGMRVGYLVARPDIAARVRNFAMADVNMLALYAAKTALEDREFYQFSLQKTKEAENYIYKTLDDLNLKYLPSHGNFVFFHAKRPIQGLIQEMLGKLPSNN